MILNLAVYNFFHPYFYLQNSWDYWTMIKLIHLAKMNQIKWIFYFHSQDLKSQYTHNHQY